MAKEVMEYRTKNRRENEPLMMPCHKPFALLAFESHRLSPVCGLGQVSCALLTIMAATSFLPVTTALMCWATEEGSS